jgi:hypothetical protein
LLRRFRTIAVLAATVAVALLFFGVRSSLAQTAVVPPDVQASLIAKLMPYDRNFAARAHSVARVLVVSKHGSGKSRAAAEAFRSALAGLGNVGGLPLDVRTVEFESAPSLVATCRSEHVAAVYVSADFDDDIPALQRSFSGVDILSVSGGSEYVPGGIVLGFELVSGKPKLVLNLAQAKLQNVNFGAEVLRLMRVYR